MNLLGFLRFSSPNRDFSIGYSDPEAIFFFLPFCRARRRHARLATPAAQVSRSIDRQVAHHSFSQKKLSPEILATAGVRP
jgi:hypothetical protein